MVPSVRRCAASASAAAAAADAAADDAAGAEAAGADASGSVYDRLPAPERVGYLAQHALFAQIPELKRDFVAPPYCDACGKLSNVNAWFGTDGTVTPLHFDTYDNFLTQAQGFKYVRLYAPSEAPFLYVDDDGGGGGGDGAERSGTEAQRNISPVRIEAPDLERHPLFAQATHTEVVLGPGEMLFIPSGTWHYVRSLTPSLSVNFWF